MTRPCALLTSGLLGLVCLLGACMQWQELAPRPSVSFALDSNQTYRFRLASGDTRVISHPHVEGDSLVWGEQVSAGTYWKIERRTLPLADVRSISVQRADAVGTMTGVGIGVLALSMLLMVASAQSLDGLRF